MSTTRTLVVGLDVSARRIGWALVSYETGQALNAGCQIVSATDDLRARREAFREVARSADALGDVGAVILEDAYAGPNRAGTIRHALAVGNVEAFAATRWPSVLVDRVKPATWRRVLGLEARGKASPLAYAADAYRVETGGELADRVSKRAHVQDAADAVCIAKAGHVIVWSHD